MALPFATVAICTYNRSRWLRGTLGFATLQDYPADRWELLVVDNNSTDDTKALIASFAQAPKAPRYLMEAQQGLSHARNRALAEARGEVVVFLDDDTEGRADWLRLLMAPYATGGGRIGIVGGEIVPGFPDGLPAWLEGQWERLDYRKDTGPLPASLLPMGANFSSLLVAARAVGGFRTDLGRKGEKLAGSEDHDFIRRVRKSGYEVWYVPEAQVVHLIPGNRLTFSYAMRHAFDSSGSRVVEKAAQVGKGRLWLFSRIVINSVHGALCTVMSVLLFLVFQPGRGKRWLTRAARAAGYVSAGLEQIVQRLEKPEAGRRNP
jgi:glycosyltransferase involved in cell wall biosynthesis